MERGFIRAPTAAATIACTGTVAYKLVWRRETAASTRRPDLDLDLDSTPAAAEPSPSRSLDLALNLDLPPPTSHRPLSFYTPRLPRGVPATAAMASRTPTMNHHLLLRPTA